MMRFFLLVATTASLLTHWAPINAESQDIVEELGLAESAAPVREFAGWKKPRKIVVLAEDEARVGSFQSVAPGVTIIGVRGPRDAAKHMKDAEALVGMCSSALVDAAPRLKWVQSQLAGVDSCIDIPRVRSGEILFTNMQRVNGSNVAEHAMALTLALTRQVNAAVINQQGEQWSRKRFASPLDLDGSTMLVVGLGGIGTEIARRARAFGMRVIATRNSSRNGPRFVDYVGLANELPDLVEQADIVVNATPLTPATTGLFDAAMFRRMKSSAYFINIGRGGSVLTDDLLEALNTRTIAGAGLDVTEPEPLPANHPLWRAPNVIITPHMAGSSRVKLDRMWAVMLENVRRFVAGEKMLSVVDVRRGY
jgi:phosphoglycerate dehydrogenase-like enzyme